MIKNGFSVMVVFLCCILVFSACGSSPNSAQNNAAAGRTAAGRVRPAWVDSVDTVYNKNLYVAAVGTGNDRPMAEKNAFAALVAIFGQSIQVDQTVSVTYQEAVKSGVTAGWSEDTAIQNTIATSSSMDALVGAEIKEAWLDSSNNTYYAAAVMEKGKSVMLYTDMIKANQEMIANLTNMNQTQKNSLEGFSRYQFAATVADINSSYENVLKVIGAAPPPGLRKGDEYRLEAANIAKTIPVAVSVRNDRSGRIQGALSKSLADLGLSGGGGNSRYRVEAELSITEVQLANQQNKFARYVVDASLLDTASGRTVLIPYNINGREGHLTVPEAENRALAAAERKITEEYKDIVSGYLSKFLRRK